MHYVEFLKNLHVRDQFKPNRNKACFKVIIRLENDGPCLSQKWRHCEWSRTCCMKLTKASLLFTFWLLEDQMEWRHRTALGMVSPWAWPPLQSSYLCAFFSETKEPLDLDQFTKGDEVEEKEQKFTEYKLYARHSGEWVLVCHSAFSTGTQRREIPSLALGNYNADSTAPCFTPLFFLLWKMPWFISPEPL